MENNPFEELGVTINSKALFQTYSHEANQVEVEKRIEVLAKIIYAGYNLNEIVNEYLQAKDALTDKVRKNEIIDTFNLYTRTTLDKAIEKGSYSPKAENLIKIFYADNEPKKLQSAINAFAIAIKERFSIRDLIVVYVEDSGKYSALSSAIGIDLGEDISKQLQEKDEKENSQPQ